MLRFPVSPSKSEDLRRRMAALKLEENDLRESFFCPNNGRFRKRGSQVGVHLRHGASGLEARCHRSTSQPLNRFLARRMLVRLLEKQREGRDGETRAKAKAKAKTGANVPSRETPEQHMQRMFSRSFEKDIAQPYPIPSQKLLGAGNLPPRLIGILGERDGAPSKSRNERRSG